MDLRPWDVSKITSGDTPISLPTLFSKVQVSEQEKAESGQDKNSRFPVLNHGVGRVDDCAVHVKQESIKDHLFWRSRVLQNICLCAAHRRRYF